MMRLYYEADPRGMHAVYYHVCTVAALYTLVRAGGGRAAAAGRARGSVLLTKPGPSNRHMAA